MYLIRWANKDFRVGLGIYTNKKAQTDYWPCDVLQKYQYLEILKVGNIINNNIYGYIETPMFLTD